MTQSEYKELQERFTKKVENMENLDSKSMSAFMDGVKACKSILHSFYENKGEETIEISKKEYYKLKSYISEEDAYRIFKEESDKLVAAVAKKVSAKFITDFLALYAGLKTAREGINGEPRPDILSQGALNGMFDFIKALAKDCGVDIESK